MFGSESGTSDIPGRGTLVTRARHPSAGPRADASFRARVTSPTLVAIAGRGRGRGLRARTGSSAPWRRPRWTDNPRSAGAGGLAGGADNLPVTARPRCLGDATELSNTTFLNKTSTTYTLAAMSDLNEFDESHLQLPSGVSGTAYQSEGCYTEYKKFSKLKQLFEQGAHEIDKSYWVESFVTDQVSEPKHKMKSNYNKIFGQNSEHHLSPTDILTSVPILRSTSLSPSCSDAVDAQSSKHISVRSSLLRSMEVIDSTSTPIDIQNGFDPVWKPENCPSLLVSLAPETSAHGVSLTPLLGGELFLYECRDAIAILHLAAPGDAPSGSSPAGPRSDSDATTPTRSWVAAAAMGAAYSPARAAATPLRPSSAPDSHALRAMDGPAAAGSPAARSRAGGSGGSRREPSGRRRGGRGRGRRPQRSAPSA